MEIYFKKRDDARAFKNADTRKLVDHGKDAAKRWGVELVKVRQHKK